MKKTQQLIETITEIYLEDSIKRISEIETRRHSLLKPQLTEVELGVLIGLAQGRQHTEINRAIKLISRKDTYNSVTQRLLHKFEASSFPHLIYKAISSGVLELKQVE